MGGEGLCGAELGECRQTRGRREGRPLSTLALQGRHGGGCLAAVGITITEVADTGSLKGDIRALLFSIRRVLRHPVVRRILPDVHAEIARSPDLRAAVRPFQARRREQVRLVVDRAIARGELAPSVDYELAADLIGTPIYWRQIVTGGRADSRYIEALATAISAAIEALGPAPPGR